MGSVWFVRGRGKVYGPLDSGRLKQLAASGKIDHQTEVATSDAGPWHPAGKLNGLFPSSRSTLHSSTPLQSGSVSNANTDSVPPAPVAATISGPGQSHEKVGRESFGDWYRRTVGGWNVVLQVIAWLAGGYVLIPLCWALAGNVPLLRIGKWIGIVLGGLLALTVVMEFVDPEGMKEARERAAQAAAARREKIATETAEKGKMKGAHIAAGLVAIDMKNNGSLRPRGDRLNALARKAADEMNVPSERRDEFVRDFEWAFNIAWDKSK